MMLLLRILLISFSMLAVLSACQEQERLQDGKPHADVSLSEEKSAILVNEKVHAFSDAVKLDTFRITLTGDSVLTSIAVLEIIKFDGSVLYQDTFAANFLIDYGINDNPTEKEMEAYILKRAEAFFQEDKFMQPAIPADRTFDSNYADKQIWDTIKSDPVAIGFVYKLGKEDSRYLAYSNAAGKVVMYLNCC